MCGIFGLIESETASDGIRPALLATEALSHRGPDDWGLLALVPHVAMERFGGAARDPRIEIRASELQHNVILGHRRLRIIDLSDAGRQPMGDASSRAWITYNGEVYNYRELRNQLAGEGVQFASETDTEVVLQAYLKWRHRSVEMLQGMFAFGIWDAEQAKLFLVRDRLGKKPLFWYSSQNRFAFASELKAFLTVPGWQPQIDPTAIHDYLTFGYVPGQRTIFKNVREVPPGCILTWKDGNIEIESYWDIESHFLEPSFNNTEEALCDDVRHLITEAVRKRLVSHVPLGAFLSGGLDSSAVVALMAGQLNSPVKTFSIGFSESSFNELEHARTVARYLHTDHHEYVVKAKAADILTDLVWYMDEPFADSSALPTFLLARLAKEHVTVVLTGDGGDECFAGYDSYWAEKWLELYMRAPKVLRDLLETGLRNCREGSSRTALLRRAKRFTEKSSLPFERREWRQLFPEDIKRAVYTTEFRAAVDTHQSLDERAQAFERWRELDPVQRLQLWDLMVYLPNDLMVKTDRMTMAHGLEARCPLLDHTLVEQCARVPSNMKVRGSTTKYLFKRSVADLLPPSIVARRKQGFGIPVSHWFRGELRDMARDILLSAESRDRGYFSSGALKNLLEAHESKRVDHGHKLWALMSFELWCRKFTKSVPFGGITNQKVTTQ